MNLNVVEFSVPTEECNCVDNCSAHCMNVESAIANTADANANPSTQLDENDNNRRATSTDDSQTSNTNNSAER